MFGSGVAALRRVSVAILTHNRASDVLRAINSAKAQENTVGLAVEIVVVDNASEDDTSERIGSEHPDVKLIRTHRNLGCPGGRNILYANCSGDVIINLDDDGELGAGVVRGAVELMESDPSIGVIAFQRIETFPPAEGHLEPKVVEVTLFSGGLSAFRRDMLLGVGYYPDDFFLLFEEEHLALRIIDAGYRIVYAPNLLMKHAFSSGSGGRRWDYYRYRNGMLNVIDLFPLSLCLPFFFLRAGSYLMRSIPRGTFRQCATAIAVAGVGIFTRTRKPVGVKTVRAYFAVRWRAGSDLSVRQAGHKWQNGE
jgi:GT2 family glycosyltransferase